jgi:hypothetical protein
MAEAIEHAPFDRAPRFGLVARCAAMSPLAPDLLARLEPDPELLLALLAEQLDDSLLDEIADGDYGEDFEQHRAALRAIRDELRVPIPMGFVPAEVLALERWSDPDDPQWRTSDAVARRGHVKRAFSCTVLIAAGGGLANPHDLDCGTDTLAHLVASLKVLGGPESAAGLRFVAWRFASLGTEVEERPFYLLAILLLALDVRRDLAPRELAALVDAVMEEEAEVRSGGWAYPGAENDEWLLGLVYGQRHEVWRALAAGLPELAQGIDGAEIREVLGDLAARLRPATGRSG